MPAPTQKKSVIRRKAEKEGAAAKKLGRKRKKSCGGQRETERGRLAWAASKKEGEDRT